MLSRREWLMIIAILLMAEAWVLNISYAFVSDQDVINYISFASTIASLLLAIIAIIYGFYQSDGQKKSASAIEYQLESMRMVQGTINNAASDLMGNVEKIVSATGALKSISDSVEGMHPKLTALETNISTIRDKQDAMIVGKFTDTISAPSAIDSAEAARKILRQTSFPADIIGYSLYRAFVICGSSQLPLWKFVKLFSSDPLGVRKVNALSVDEWTTLTGQIVFMLGAFGFLKINLDSDDPSKSSIEITAQNFEELRKIAEVTKKSSHTEKAIELLDAVTW